jgi:hypothetical protein
MNENQKEALEQYNFIRGKVQIHQEGLTAFLSKRCRDAESPRILDDLHISDEGFEEITKASVWFGDNFEALVNKFAEKIKRMDVKLGELRTKAKTPRAHFYARTEEDTVEYTALSSTTGKRLRSPL